MSRKRRDHLSEFKAKVTLAGVKEDETLQAFKTTPNQRYGIVEDLKLAA